MVKNIDDNQAAAKKSLINSFENLQLKLNQLVGVRQLSEKMIRKFERIDNEPVNEVIEKGKEPLTPNKPDIIDLFDDTASCLQEEINNISTNIEKMLNWIE